MTIHSTSTTTKTPGAGDSGITAGLSDTYLPQGTTGLCREPGAHLCPSVSPDLQIGHADAHPVLPTCRRMITVMCG